MPACPWPKGGKNARRCDPTMDPDQVAHFERIRACADAIATLAWIEASAPPEAIMPVLPDFDSKH